MLMCHNRCSCLHNKLFFQFVLVNKLAFCQNSVIYQGILSIWHLASFSTNKWMNLSIVYKVRKSDKQCLTTEYIIRLFLDVIRTFFFNLTNKSLQTKCFNLHFFPRAIRHGLRHPCAVPEQLSRHSAAAQDHRDTGL